MNNKTIKNIIRIDFKDNDFGLEIEEFINNYRKIGFSRQIDIMKKENEEAYIKKHGEPMIELSPREIMDLEEGTEEHKRYYSERFLVHGSKKMNEYYTKFREYMKFTGFEDPYDLFSNPKNKDREKNIKRFTQLLKDSLYDYLQDVRDKETADYIIRNVEITLTDKYVSQWENGEVAYIFMSKNIQFIN